MSVSFPPVATGTWVVPTSQKGYALFLYPQLSVISRDRVLYCSPSSLRVTGHAPEQFAADPGLWNSLVHPLDSSLWREHRASAHAGVSVDELQFRIVTKEGATRWIEHVCTPVHDAAGLLLGTVSSNRDITGRKALEARLLRVQRLETVGALTGGVAHDLNNVLTPILLGIEVLRERITDEAGRRLVESMESSARRGADLVHQVMMLTRSGDWDRAAVPVRPLVSEIEKIVRETFPPAIRFSARVPGDLWSISVNPVVLTQVLMNLCLVSRDAMPQGGSLEITAERTVSPARPQPVTRGPEAGHQILLSVRHRGTASAKKAPDRHAETQGAPEKRPSAASRVAAATYSLVQQHGGLLVVAGEPGEETTFRLSFPAVPPPQAGEAAGKDAPPPNGNGELLLLVDDEGVIREATRVVLEGHGYRVLSAGGGAEALTLYAVRWQEIALVLTDMMMPLMDGRTTMVALKRINPRVKVLAMSGQAQADERSGVAAGEFEAFLQKPFGSAPLLRAIGDVLRR